MSADEASDALVALDAVPAKVGLVPWEQVKELLLLASDRVFRNFRKPFVPDVLKRFSFE